MSLVVTFKNREVAGTHVPFSQEFARKIQSLASAVDFIYADGDEHEFILSRLVGLPHGHAYTTWTGEWARFIADNFPFDIYSGITDRNAQ